MKSQNKFKIVLLFSGGIDSSTLALLLSNEGFDIFPLFVDYGQNAAPQEWYSCLKVLNFLRLSKPKRVDIRSLGRISKNLLTAKIQNEEKNPFFPFRNLILASVGALYANSLDCNSIGLGIIDGGGTSFPDCTKEFIDGLSKVLELSIDKSVVLCVPFLELNKAEVILYGLRHDFPYDITYSCLLGETEHCGKCESCISRKQAFKVLGVDDKTRYR